MDADLLHQFEELARREYPKLKVAYKDEARSQKVLSFLIEPFNGRYMQVFSSTFGSTVYFPSRKFFEENAQRSFTVLAHELVHVHDAKDALYSVKYLFPQILGVIPLLVYGVLAGVHAWILLLPFLAYGIGLLVHRRSKFLFYLFVVMGVLGMFVLGWFLTKWKIFVLLGLVVLGPWPASWRVQYELRGFGMNMAVRQWLAGGVTDRTKEFYVKEFTGPGYYFMSWDPAFITRHLEATRQQAQVGALQGLSPYKLVHDFLYARGLMHRMRRGS